MKKMLTLMKSYTPLKKPSQENRSCQLSTTLQSQFEATEDGGVWTDKLVTCQSYLSTVY